MQKKQANRNLAVMMWNEHATDILKGHAPVEAEGITQRNVRLEQIEAEKLASAIEFEFDEVAFSKMTKEEKKVYREKQRGLAIVEKKKKKDSEDLVVEAKVAEKAKMKQAVDEGKALNLDEAAILEKERQFEEQMARSSLPEKEKVERRRLIKSGKALALLDKTEAKYGAGSNITAQGSDKRGADGSKLVDRVVRPLKSAGYGWTSGVKNIRGVYKWGFEIKDQISHQNDGMREVEDARREKEEKKIIDVTAKRSAEKAKKRRMKKNGGVDPQDEKKPSRAQVIKRERENKDAARKARHEGRREKGLDSDEGSAGSESDESFDSGDDGEGGGGGEIRLEYDPNADSVSKREADREAKVRRRGRRRKRKRMKE